MMNVVKGVAIAACVLGAVDASAQARPEHPRDTVSAERRAVLERQVRQRIAVMVKQRLQLSDAQAQQLQEAESRFELRRHDLMQREHRLRGDLRQEMATPSADQPRVASLLDQIMAVHRERVTMVEQEQRDLARFLTPVQRAKYLGLQGQLQNRIEGMRQGGRGEPGAQRQRPPGRPRPER